MIQEKNFSELFLRVLLTCEREFGAKSRDANLHNQHISLIALPSLSSSQIFPIPPQPFKIPKPKAFTKTQTSRCACISRGLHTVPQVFPLFPPSYSRLPHLRQTLSSTERAQLNLIHQNLFFLLPLIHSNPYPNTYLFGRTYFQPEPSHYLKRNPRPILTSRTLTLVIQQ